MEETRDMGINNFNKSLNMIYEIYLMPAHHFPLEAKGLVSEEQVLGKPVS